MATTACTQNVDPDLNADPDAEFNTISPFNVNSDYYYSKDFQGLQLQIWGNTNNQSAKS